MGAPFIFCYLILQLPRTGDSCLHVHRGKYHNRYFHGLPRSTFWPLMTTNNQFETNQFNNVVKGIWCFSSCSRLASFLPAASWRQTGLFLGLCRVMERKPVPSKCKCKHPERSSNNHVSCLMRNWWKLKHQTSKLKIFEIFLVLPVSLSESSALSPPPPWDFLSGMK